MFDRNVNGWVIIPGGMQLPQEQQDRDMLVRELIVNFQGAKSDNLLHQVKQSYPKF